jgi:hypothetical protein
LECRELSCLGTQKVQLQDRKRALWVHFSSPFFSVLSQPQVLLQLPLSSFPLFSFQIGGVDFPKAFGILSGDDGWVGDVVLVALEAGD